MNHSATGFTFFGHVETTVDALRVVYAAHVGVIPRVRKRFTSQQRKAYIISGGVFVFHERESGMNRWTDGLSWSPSRVDGNFLIYQEMQEVPATNDQERTKVEKRNGLRKRTLCVTIRGNTRQNDHILHLICYFKQDHVVSNAIMRPSFHPDIMAFRLPPEIFQLDELRSPSTVVTGPDGMQKFVEMEETDPVHLTPMYFPAADHDTPKSVGNYMTGSPRAPYDPYRSELALAALDIAASNVSNPQGSHGVNLVNIDGVHYTYNMYWG
ncbi:Gti1/Pac2 family-domain-containing protein [Mycena rebaudengoi]|nr:Gti1/Pac2 family-domain-containing protein [Mycena rebaudengoi]